MATSHNKVSPEEKPSAADLEMGPPKTRKRPSTAGKKAVPKWKALALEFNKILNHNITQGILALALVVSLFLPDLWVISNPDNDADIALNVILVITFVLFVLEVVVTTIAREEYFNSFFFWMDILGTLSILIDITWISNSVSMLQANADNGTTLRAARVAKLGAKSGRLAKLVKLFKFLNPDSNQEELQADATTPAQRISKQLGTMLSQRVAALVMLLIIVNPFLSASITDFSGAGFLTSIDTAVSKLDMDAASWQSWASDFYKFYTKLGRGGATVSYPVWLKVQGMSLSDCPTTDSEVSFSSSGGGTCTWKWGLRQTNLRSMNRRIIGGSGSLRDYEALFDTTSTAVEEAWYSIILIVLVIFLLITFTASFNLAVDRLVVNPIQRIISKLRVAAAGVLASMRDMVDGIDEDEDEGVAFNETDVLEKMVEKLARVVNKTMGNDMQDLINAQGDEHTQQWLNSDYFSSQRRKSSNEKSNAPQEAVGGAGVMPGPLSSAAVSTELLPVDAGIIDSFEFDVLTLSGDELVPVVKYMFDKHQLLTEFSIEPAVFERFVQSIKGGYNTTPAYHTWHHGCDVMYTVYLLLNSTKSHTFMNKLEVFASLVSALAHDIGHPGYNNAFLVKTKDQLAILHNDKSPLENMHCATLYEILRDDATNIMSNLSEEQWQDCRKSILACILNTDMALHFSNTKELEVFEEVNGFAIAEFLQHQSDGIPTNVPRCLDDPNNRLMIQHTFLHAADLGNPVKPIAFYEKWVERVTGEFFAQGDKEKELGVPVSAMCDRDSTNIPTMQMGFIDFIIAPFYSTMIKLFPHCIEPLGENLQANYVYYADLHIGEKGPGPDADKAEAKKQALVKKIQGALDSSSV